MRSEGIFDWEKFNKSDKSLIKSTEFRPLIDFVKTITTCDYFIKVDKKMHFQNVILFLCILYSFNR